MSLAAPGRLAALAAPLALAFALVAGCGGARPPAVTDTAPTAEPDDGIAWFAGTVEEAFAVAKAERRPLFLYWGAEWCPPCHVLRARLFTRPSFQARLAQAVAVYLDGDTERAQIWGEKLATAGYPTVLVFDADGREVMRLNSLIPVEQLEATLGAALTAGRPLEEMVAAVRTAGAGTLAPAELNLLAFHSWFQDEQLELDLLARRELFGELWRGTPTVLATEENRFLALYADALAESDGDRPPAAINNAERAVLARGVRAILGDRDARLVNLDVVSYGASMVTFLAPSPGAERDDLVAAWDAAAAAVEAEERLSASERVAVLNAPLRLARLGVADGAEPPPLPPALVERIRARVRWAADAVTDADELQGLMNVAGGLLERAELHADVKALLSEKAAQTSAPYYYVGWQASLEEDEGHAEEAVRLYREAWQGARATGSQAGMTPLRWGSTYLRKRTALAPDDAPAIAADAAQILDEVLATPDAFAGGNWSRLQAIDRALEEWSAGHPDRAAIVRSLDDRLRAACADVADDGPDSPAARCRSLVEAKTAA